MVKFQPYTLRNVLVIVEQPIYRDGDKGEDSCMLGSTISNRGDCETACESFPKEIGGTLKDGNRCYQAGNGKCRQDGREGSGASLICESKLYNIILLYLSVLTGTSIEYLNIFYGLYLVCRVGGNVGDDTAQGSCASGHLCRPDGTCRKGILYQLFMSL